MYRKVYSVFLLWSLTCFVRKTESQAGNGNFIGTPWWFAFTTQPSHFQTRPPAPTRPPVQTRPPVATRPPFRIEPTTTTTTTTERTTTTTTVKPVVDASDTISENCFAQPKCVPQHQQTQPFLEGICNNPIDKNRGRMDRPLKRLLPPKYGDKLGSPRLGKDGNELPSARKISLILNLEPQRHSVKISHMMPWWGQFMTHEFTHTPKGERPNGAAFNCDCDKPDKDGCHNIPVEETDSHFKKYDERCIQVVRSEPWPNVDCNSTIREQKNRISAYIDASGVYGNSDAETKQFLARHTTIGELETGNYAGDGIDAGLASQSQVHRDFAARMNCPALVHKPPDKPCLMAGDTRANENTGLSAIHVMFVRQHNKIVNELRRINPQWQNERLVMETKSIIAAMLQIITYQEYLPLLLGDKYMERFKLNVLRKGYWYGYDTSVDATISNVFATAAFRYGHTNVDKEITRPAPDWFTPEADALPVKDIFFNNEPLLEQFSGGVNSVLRGLTKDKALVTDAKMNHDMKELLFESKLEPGQDLFALNMQRGRDHGLPSYNEYRELCGMKRVTSFDDIPEIRENTRKRLSSVYSDIEDLDVYVAGLAETAVDGGIVGPTFACIIGYQFRDIKAGDRFWFENGGRHSIFTTKQLDALRQYSLAKLMCDTMSDLRSIQPNPMLQASVPGNRRQFCRSMTSIDLNPWRENPNEQKDDKTEDEFEWSPWIPCVTSRGVVTSVTTAINDALVYRPNDICRDMVDSETRIVNSVTQVRVKCLRGALKATDFPYIDSGYEVVWTAWSDRSTPDRTSGDDDESRSEEESCRRPIAIQVQTVNGVPATETGDVFESIGVFDGFVCRGEHQPSQRCQDYRVRYMCRKSDRDGSTRSSSSESPSGPPPTKETVKNPNALIWSPWISNDTPAGDGDSELLSDVANLPGYCKNPFYMDARTVGTHLDLRRAGDIIDEESYTVGLICSNDKQQLKNCHDYEVRYLCRNADINKETGVPPYVGKQARDFCRSYGICCP